MKSLIDISSFEKILKTASYGIVCDEFYSCFLWMLGELATLPVNFQKRVFVKAAIYQKRSLRTRLGVMWVCTAKYLIFLLRIGILTPK